MKVLAIVAIALVAGINAGTYTDRFLEQYQKIKSASSGYFSKEGVPYHSVETLIVEAPDQGHETTSEAVRSVADDLILVLILSNLVKFQLLRMA